MRKANMSSLVVIVIVFAAFTLGFFLGRNHSSNDISVSVPDRFLTIPTETTASWTESTEETDGISFPIAINQAGMEEFTELPGIGEVLAERIIAYRNENGMFSSPEELLNVEGIGKKRLEEIMDLITIGG